MPTLARLIALAIRNPVVTASAFIAVVVLFTTLIVVSYPDAEGDQVLPVVQAQTDYKVAPDFESGMDIAHQDSTVYDVLRASQGGEGGVENLLGEMETASNDVTEPSMNKPPSKDELLAEQSNDSALSDEDRALLAMLSEELKEPATPETMDAMDEITPAPEKVAQRPDPAPAPSVPAVTPKMKPAAPQETQQVAAFDPYKAPVPVQQPVTRSAAAAPVQQPAPKRIEISRVDPAATQPKTAQSVEASRTPKRMHEPGTSPDTLEFVRSVLDQKDNKQMASNQSAEDLANIAPAAGEPNAQMAARMNSINPTAGTEGNTSALTPPREHYVQLGSVRSESGAESEWHKLQSTFFPELGGAAHRVTTADLGDKGVYYRIQAGPFTAEKASAICASIKTQKPGGCLVVR